MTTSFSFGKTASLKKPNRYQFSPAMHAAKGLRTYLDASLKSNLFISYRQLLLFLRLTN